MKNKSLIVFCIALAAWLFWREYSKEDIVLPVPDAVVFKEEPLVPVVQEKAISQPTKENLTSQKPKSLEVESSVLEGKSQASQDPSKIPEFLDFKIDKDGWAVAFGDVLLGVLPPGEKVKYGLTKAQNIQLWEGGEVPYVIAKNFPNPERIFAAFEQFKDTPISFVSYQGQPDAIIFESKPGNCRSYLGRIGGVQPILLDTNCDTKEIVHEIMHALGFVHEHSRTDRDQYIEIVWDNIQPEFKSQFALVPQILMEPIVGTYFDHESIMIYPEKLFAKSEGLTTIKSKTELKIQPSEGLSREDIRRLNRVY